MKFRPKGEDELSRLSDDDLVAHLSAARDAGQDDQVRSATNIFIARRWRVLINRARLKLKDEDDVDDIVQETVLGTLKSDFKGTSPGELFSFMNRILERRIADFYDKKSRTPPMVAPDADGNSPFDGIADPDDDISEALTMAVIEDVLDSCSERDRMVIQMKMEGMPSKEIALAVSGSGMNGRVEMTPANVDKIFSRFRERLREELSDPETDLDPPSDPPDQPDPPDERGPESPA